MSERKRTFVFFLYTLFMKAAIGRFFLYSGVKKRIETFCYTNVTMFQVI